MCLTLVPVTVLADDDIQQINDTAVQAITPGSDVSVLSVVKPDDAYYRTYEFYVDGEEINTQIVKNGDTLYEPPVTAPAGKTFTGWDNKDVHFGTISGITATETITVNAVFEDGYHVYFKDNSGRIIATKKGKTGDIINFEDVNFPVGADEAITGWYTDEGFTTKVDSVTIATSSVTLYAKVEQGYWVTFESNGGSYVAPAFYANGTTAEAPDEPAKSGYTFAGWYTDEGLMTAADFSAIKTSATLYAKWRENGNTRYTVIHWLENADDDGYSADTAVDTKYGKTGADTAASARSYTGFTAQTITQKTIAGDGSTIVSVYYKRNVYKVTFYLDDPIYTCGKEAHTHSRLKGCYNLKGELTCKKEEHTHSSACKTETIVIEAKYGANISDQWPTVNGSSTWRTKKNSGPYQVNIDTMPLGGTNFYGPKTGNRYETAYYYVEVLPGETGESGPGNLNYKLDHEDTSPGTGYYVTKEDKYNITGFTYKDGTQNGGSYNGAKFYYTRNSYNILFMNNGVKEKTVAKKFEQSIEDASYTPAAPAGMTDYVFDGWYTNEQCEGDAFVFTGKTMPANNITLYAKWVAPTYTVTVYDQDGNKLDEITVSKGDTVTDWLSTQKNKITLDTGDSFLGWTINRGLPFNPGTKITTNYNLYAKVGNSTGYSVTYDANGGTGSVTDTEKYAKGAEATVKSNNGFTNGDKVFLSWNTAADGTGKTYYPNSTVEITGNVTLYAQWGDKASTVSVTYHSNFDTDQTKTVKDIANNGQITVEDYSATGLPAREGYTFAGWTTEANGSGTKFSAGDSARVDNGSNDLYAQWEINQYNYTVEYYIDNVKNALMTETDKAAFGSEINSYPDKCPDGYALEKTANLPLTIGVNESANVIKVFYKKNVFNLTIHYVYAEDQSKAADDYTKSVTFNDTYTVTSPTINGYTADTTVVSGNMPAENVTVTVTYSKRTDLSYTVNYYWNDKTTLLNSKTVNDQTFNASVTESPIAIEGYTAVSNASQTITIGTGTNEINFYYYKNVELTANSGTATYDGNEHSVSGFTGAPADADFSAITVGAKGTEADTYPASFADGIVGTVDATEKYIVTAANDGALVITPVEEVIVTITGHNDSVKYDGATHTVDGYDVAIDNELYTEQDFTFSGSSTVSGTNAKTSYEMGLKAGDFTNNSKNFTNVTFQVTDGYLTITKRNVTLTSGSDSKAYDGTPLTKNEVTVSGDGFAEGEGASYNVTGTITNVGKVDNTFDYNLKSNTKADNYNITKETGTLEVTPVTDKVTVTITEHGGSAKYDGTEKTVTGYDVAISNPLYTEDDFTFSGNATVKGTDVGTYDMELKSSDFTNISKNFSNVEFVIEDGSLVIDPAEVTVTIKGNTDEVTYNGKEQSVEGYTFEITDKTGLYTVNDFALIEGVTAVAKGTDAGEYFMGLTVDSFTNSNPNFKVTFVVEDGKLTIKPAEVTVTIKGNTAEVIYNGKEQSVEGYTFEITDETELYAESDFVLKDGIEAVAKGTNANDPEGTIKSYPMGLTKDSFENKNVNFAVTFEVTDGSLTIAKRDVTVTGESATKSYNGQTQEITGYTVDNLVEGHKMTGVTYSAKGKDPGKYDGSFTGSQIVITDADGSNVTENYNVKTVIGALTITQPSHPTRPSTPTKDVTSVKTADGSQMTLWMSMTLASAAGIVFFGKKRKEEQ